MKQFSDTIPAQQSLKQGQALSSLLFKFALEFSIRKTTQSRRALNGMGSISSRPVLIMVIY